MIHPLKRTSRHLSLAIAPLVVLGSIFNISVFYTLRRSPKITPVINLGNGDANISAIASPDLNREYSFLVVGDSKHGDEIFETLIDKADRIESLNFGVHLGDFVAHSTAGEFAFFVHEFSERPHFPMLMVPGNHDVNPSEGKQRLFEQVMGRRELLFRYGGDLFVIIDNAVRDTNLSLAWLESVLNRHAKDSRHIFLFLHRPVFEVEKASDKIVLQPDNRFHALVRRFKVARVFMGHYHSYIRKEIDGVEYVVTGGGGSELYGGRGFFHAIVVDVRPSGIQESMLTTPFKFGLDDEYTGWLYEVFYEWYHRDPRRFISYLVGFQLALLTIFILLLRKGRQSAHRSSSVE